MWILLTLSLLQAASANKCYGLSIEGGGVHGAYESGAIYSIVRNVPADTVKWNFIHGVSTGALNTGAYSQYPIGQELEMTDFAVQTWRAITGSANLYSLWNGDPIDWLLREQGLVNNDPLRQFIIPRMPKSQQRPVSVGTTNVSEASFQILDETLSITDFQEAIMCSSAVPALFPHQNVFGKVFADGMILHNMDIATVIQRCRTSGAADQDIVIDLIFDSYPGAYNANLDNAHTIDILGLIDDIEDMDEELRFLSEAKLAFPHVNFRYVVFPSEPVGFPLQLDPTHIEWLIQLGMKDGKTVVQNFDEGLEKYKEMYQNRMRIVKAE